jgi:hypothetical protein
LPKVSKISTPPLIDPDVRFIRALAKAAGHERSQRAMKERTDRRETYSHWRNSGEILTSSEIVEQKTDDL